MRALIVVDMQKDFMPGGPLGVPGADTLVPLINKLMEKFPVILATKDWHPKIHKSFAIQHPGKKEGETVQVGKTKQILWPVHCVQDTEGAEFVEDLHTKKFDAIFYKGIDPEIDSYSTFYDNAHLRKTGLDTYLRQNHIKNIVLVGVATEYCVLYSALDGIKLGYYVQVIQDACKPINLHPEDEQNAFDAMKKHGVNIVQSREVL